MIGKGILKLTKQLILLLTKDLVITEQLLLQQPRHCFATLLVLLTSSARKNGSTPGFKDRNLLCLQVHEHKAYYSFVNLYRDILLKFMHIKL